MVRKTGAERDVCAWSLQAPPLRPAGVRRRGLLVAALRGEVPHRPSWHDGPPRRAARERRACRWHRVQVPGVSVAPRRGLRSVLPHRNLRRTTRHRLVPRAPAPRRGARDLSLARRGAVVAPAREHSRLIVRAVNSGSLDQMVRHMSGGALTHHSTFTDRAQARAERSSPVRRSATQSAFRALPAARTLQTPTTPLCATLRGASSHRSRARWR